VSDGQDLQNDLCCYRVFNTGQDWVIVGVSRGGEVGGRSELRGLSPDLLKVVQTANF
jgi:hypothetical protein